MTGSSNPAEGEAAGKSGDRRQLWSAFLAEWPAERVRQMSLEEYTNPNRDDAFVYWVETRLDDLGSISGSVAFKFGIFRRGATEAKESGRGRLYSEKYWWWARYGKTEEEAFAVVRAQLVEVIQCVRDDNLARIEEIDLAPIYKWKVAFLYQDRTNPVLFAIYKKEALFHHYREIVPNAKLGSTPYHVMYETLLERYAELGDVFAIGATLWDRYLRGRSVTPRAWAVPLAWAADTSAVDTLVKKEKVQAEDVDSFLENMLSASDLAEGDRIALMIEGDVRALGNLTSVGAGQFAWDQVPVNFPSGLLINPSFEVRELDAAERQEIWSHLPVAQPKAGATAGPRYWKLAPGKDGAGWSEWKERGIAAVGWQKLGDLAACTETEFLARSASAYGKSDRREGPYQAWVFKGIRPGDRVVANQGTHAVLGIGTVTEGYRFRPGEHAIDAGDFPHQIKVRWDDTTRRVVTQGGWRRTLLELSKEEFDQLVALGPAQLPPPPEPPPLPCEPRNVILYGPPGTGKTYSTVRRALELILGSEKLEGLSEKGLTALFREHQALGQIEFVTFHQAYGYEEFVEGIRPVLEQGAGAEVRYELHDGVFKRIALRAAAEGLRVEAVQPGFDELWDFLVRDLNRDGTRTATSAKGKTYQLSLSSQGSIVAQACEVDGEGTVHLADRTEQVASKENARLYWQNRAELGPEPEKFTYDKTTQLFAREKGGTGGNHYTALWIVYTQLLALSRLVGARKAELLDPGARVQQAIDKPGPTTTFAFSARTPQYVLIIDEINRGNMSKILGELITLLEPDKRLASKNELKLPLSYSPQHRFAVPPNLHVLGTMNTADRSIALMDVALRRRFTFEELMPDAGVIRSALRMRVPSKALIELVADVFDALNERIRFLYDRDHQLGHSYFLEITSVGGLRQVLVDRIVPLLQEYFYGAWDKICIVLGCPFSEGGVPKRKEAHLLDLSVAGKAYAHPIVTASTFPEIKTLGFDHEDYEDRVDYRVRSAFGNGTLADEDLFRTFLGVLTIDGATFEQRLGELTAQAAATLAMVEGAR